MRHFIFALSVLAVLGTSSQSLAQENDRAREVHRRNQCRLAAQVLTSGHPANKREWAEGFIGNCPSEAPAILAERWLSNGQTVMQIRVLASHSFQIPDRRIYAGVLKAATDATRDPYLRIGALTTLASYAMPSEPVGIGSVTPPPTRIMRPMGPVTTGGSPHSHQLTAEQPLGDIFAEVLGTLDSIAARENTEPTEVWYAAGRLRQTLRHARGIEYQDR
jgi:hypothetical protein